MAVVIRLQGLRVTAGSEDIRKFFTGLKIPDGGVHIIGGEQEEAFIIFASDEDARRAMTRSGGVIRGSPVTLLLSSKTEMQNVLERTTQIVELDQKRQNEANEPYAGRSADPKVDRRSSGRTEFSPPIDRKRDMDTERYFVVFLNGLPFSVTENEICEFFKGLETDEIVLLKNHRGQNNGKAFVRFVSVEDALEGLKRNREYIGTRYVEVCTTTVNEWYRATGRMPMGVNMDDNFERGRMPDHSQRTPQHARSRSPMMQRHALASEEEYCVLLDNLSYGMEKDDIKQMFRNAKLDNDQILYLTDGEGKRTRSAFVLFKSFHDYSDAISNEKKLLYNRWVNVQPISRENMLSLLQSQNTAVRPPENNQSYQERPPSHPRDSYESEKACVFVRNLPFDVRKVEIMDFFHGFNVSESRVSVLHGPKGAGVGQAVVLFESEAAAMEALCLNGQRFLGSEVILKCISRFQMKQLTTEPQMRQEPPSREEWYPGRRSRSSEPSFRPDNALYSDFRNPRDGILPQGNAQSHMHRGSDYEPPAVKPRPSRDWGNGAHGSFGSPVQHFDGPTCVQLVNLPFQIKSEEIYDFCYGYRIIPGSVSLQYDQGGKPKGSATLVFESRQEALTALRELNGRPIGPRKIELILL
ncbi:RNA-binding protein 12B [Oryzias melastigma]|nr:RNA-binding protein 12B isoform X2 [Oryzias melastigma]XP_036071811.1 RNA-binding protein 12B isoform X2 [Oryzias melastigma]KAF6739548.1 RNA-binding protein 12B [Oryzias melastigma]